VRVATSAVLVLCAATGCNTYTDALLLPKPGGAGDSGAEAGKSGEAGSGGESAGGRGGATGEGEGGGAGEAGTAAELGGAAGQGGVTVAQGGVTDGGVGGLGLGGRSGGGEGNGGASGSGLGGSAGATAEGGASLGGRGGASTAGEGGEAEGGSGDGGAGAVGGRSEPEGGAAGEGGSGEGGSGAGGSGAGGSGAGGGGDAGEAGQAAGGGQSGEGGGAGAAGSGGVDDCGTDGVSVIDDMEDGDNALLGCAGRWGYWYSFLSNGTVDALEPDPSEQFTMVELGEPVSPAGDSLLGAHFAATGLSGEAGLGLSLYTPLGTNLAYDLSAYLRVRFWYRTVGISDTTEELRFRVTLEGTTPVLEDGTCDSNCSDHYYRKIQAAEEWTLAEVLLDTSADGLAQEGWGAVVEWAPTTALALQFLAKTAAATDVEFFIDQLELVGVP